MENRKINSFNILERKVFELNSGHTAMLGSEGQLCVTACGSEHTGTKCPPGSIPGLLSSSAAGCRASSCVAVGHHLVSLWRPSAAELSADGGQCHTELSFT